MSEFIPDLAGSGVSKHVKRSFWQTLFAILVCWAWAIIVLGSYSTLNPADPTALLRWLAEGYVHITYALTVFFAAIWFLQWYTNGNMTGRILSDARACAILLSGVGLCIVLLLIGC